MASEPSTLNFGLRYNDFTTVNMWGAMFSPDSGFQQITNSGSDDILEFWHKRTGFILIIIRSRIFPGVHGLEYTNPIDQRI